MYIGEIENEGCVHLQYLPLATLYNSVKTGAHLLYTHTYILTSTLYIHVMYLFQNVNVKPWFFPWKQVNQIVGFLSSPTAGPALSRFAFPGTLYR